jgi:hypothetical protein
MSVTKMPYKYQLRVYFMILMCFSLAVNTVFQAYVTSYIVQPEYHKQIASVDDLITSGIEYGFYPGLGVLLSDSSDWRIEEILSHRIPCFGETCMLRAIEKMDFAILLDTAYAEYRKVYAATHKSVLCSFEQESMTRLTAMYLEKGNFLQDNVNRLIVAALEGGLCNFWWNNIMDSLKIKAAADVRTTFAYDNEAILLIHLQGAFYLLQFCYCISLIAFLGELFYNKLCTKTTK